MPLPALLCSISLILIVTGMAGVVHAASPVVTILHEGYVKPIEGRQLIPGQQDDGARKVASTVATVTAGDALIVVDPGMVAADIQISELLARQGHAVADVTHVFVSHHHPDHTLHMGLFPNASIVDFWAVYKDDHWADHGDHYAITDQVWVMRTPGHTDEDASLVVETERGVYVFTHVWWNEQMQPEIDPLAENAAQLQQSRDKVLEVADFIIPGHGSLFKNPQRAP